MRGAEGVAAHHPQYYGRRAGGIDGILGGFEAVEPELSVLISAELSAEVVAGLVLRVEDVVFTVGAGLPHVEHGAGNAFASVKIFDDPVEQRELPIFWHVLDDGGAKIPEWCFRRPERSKNGG